VRTAIPAPAVPEFYHDEGNIVRCPRRLRDQLILRVGAIPITGNSKQFGAMLVTATERWRKMVEISGQNKE